MVGNLNFFTHTAKALIKESILIWRESTLFLFVLSCHGSHAINRFFHVVALFSPKILFFYAFSQYFQVRKHILQTKSKGQTHELNCKLLFFASGSHSYKLRHFPTVGFVPWHILHLPIGALYSVDTLRNLKRFIK